MPANASTVDQHDAEHARADRAAAGATGARFGCVVVRGGAGACAAGGPAVARPDPGERRGACVTGAARHRARDRRGGRGLAAGAARDHGCWAPRLGFVFDQSAMVVGGRCRRRPWASVRRAT